jgi:ATP-dependent Lon protease
MQSKYTLFNPENYNKVREEDIKKFNAARRKELNPKPLFSEHIKNLDVRFVENKRVIVVVGVNFSTSGGQARGRVDYSEESIKAIYDYFKYKNENNRIKKANKGKEKFKNYLEILGHALSAREELTRALNTEERVEQLVLLYERYINALKIADEKGKNVSGYIMGKHKKYFLHERGFCEQQIVYIESCITEAEGKKAQLLAEQIQEVNNSSHIRSKL